MTTSNPELRTIARELLAANYRCDTLSAAVHALALADLILADEPPTCRADDGQPVPEHGALCKACREEAIQ